MKCYNSTENKIVLVNQTIISIANKFNKNESIGFEEKQYIGMKCEKLKHHMTWVSELPYKKHEVIVMELKVEQESKEDVKFQRITNLKITGNGILICTGRMKSLKNQEWRI